MKNRRIQQLTAGVALLFALTFCACDKYGDDLRSIGHRVEILEDSVLQINNDLELLREFIVTFQKEGFITDITHLPDGTYSLTFNDGRNVILRDGLVGADGKDGQDGSSSLDLNARQDEDGVWYWTLNGNWLLNDEGEKMPVAGADGKDGKDGQNGRDGQDGQDGQDDINLTLPVPQVRINPETRCWEISTDNGNTWKDTGIKADGVDGKDGVDGVDGKDGKNGVDGKDGKDGKDGVDGVNGKDGKDGKDGAPGPIRSVIISEDGQYVTIVMTDGRTFILMVSNSRTSNPS